MSVPDNAFSVLMDSPRRGVVRKKPDDDNKDKPSPTCVDDSDDVKYLSLLKRTSREQFMRKFEPIIKAGGDYTELGGYPDNPCWLVKGYAKQGKGRPRASYQVYLQGREERVTISGARAAVIIALIRASESKEDIEWPYPAHFQASHLCHQANCIRPAHIVMESGVDNLSRDGCPGVVFCPSCPVILKGCAHSPICIRSNWAVTCNSCGHGIDESKSQDD